METALAYWESDTAERINVVLVALQKIVLQRLRAHNFGQHLDEIIRRHCKD